MFRNIYEGRSGVIDPGGHRISARARGDGGRIAAGAPSCAGQHLTDQGLTNYWGYNTIGFFAPYTRYALCS